jgi:hypothetical protein
MPILNPRLEVGNRPLPLEELVAVELGIDVDPVSRACLGDGGTQDAVGCRSHGGVLDDHRGDPVLEVVVRLVDVGQLHDAERSRASAAPTRGDRGAQFKLR